MKTAVDARDVAILAALADPIRLQIVKRLFMAHEISGAELAERLGISRALLCHHAGILVGASLVKRRSAGQTRYLRLDLGDLERCLARLGMRAPSRKRASAPARKGTKAVRSR